MEKGKKKGRKEGKKGKFLKKRKSRILTNTEYEFPRSNTNGSPYTTVKPIFIQWPASC